MSMLLSAVAGQGGIKPCGAPGTLSLSAGTPRDTVITLSWSAPSDTGGGVISGYQIKKDGSVLVADTSSTGTTYSATGLTAATSYSFTVAAINEAGAGTDGNTPSLTTHVAFAAATGGTITTWANFKAHTFTSSADIVFSVGGACAILSVAGGGGSSTRVGGGAGGMLVETVTAAATTYAVVVGAGGSGNLQGSSTDPALPSATVAVGGGKYAGAGGSGGGGGGTGGSGTAGQGNDGGVEAINTGRYAGGGGGGKGAVGGNASWAGYNGTGGVGGAGATNDYRTGVAETFAGGGGGGQQGSSPYAVVGGAGGSGGGGAGNTNGWGTGWTPSAGVSGTANTGGGAGGSNGASATNGGSGRVTIRYEYQ